MNNGQMKGIFLSLGICVLVCGAVGFPVFQILLGSRHAMAFILGTVLGVANLGLFFIIGRMILQPKEPGRRKVKGLIFLVVLKYLMLFGLLFATIYLWKWPPVPLIAGLMLVFPAVTLTLRIRNRGDA